MGKNKRFFSSKQESKIVKAITKAEKNTSGEIRVHIESQPSENHVQRAIEVFQELDMNQTKNRNGVLFHLSPVDHNFTIVGDVEIDAITPDDFWDDIKEKVIEYFKEEAYTEGIIVGIKMAGKALKKYFPYEENDQNELPNEISQS